MEGLNRIIFLVLGLVAVVIFFAVLTGRINLKGKLPTLSGDTTKETITPTTSPSTVPSSQNKNNTNTSQNKPYTTPTSNKTSSNAKPLTTIPATGISEFFFALVFVLLAIGAYMKLTKGQSSSGGKWQ